MAEVPATHWDENGGGWPVERFARSFSADQSQFLITPLFSWGHVPFRSSAIGGAGEFSEEANLDACSRFTLLTESYGGGGGGLAGISGKLVVWGTKRSGGGGDREAAGLGGCGVVGGRGVEGISGKLLVWRTKQSGVACHRKPASLGFSEVSSVSD